MTLGFGLCVNAPLQARAEITVSTIGGGPQANPKVWNGNNGTTNVLNQYAQFYAPRSCALDSSGYLYVADTTNYMVRKMGVGTNTSGITSTLFNFKTANLMPVGVAVDDANNLFILTQGDSALRKYSLSAARFIWTNQLAAVPTAVGVSRDGNSKAFVALKNGSIYTITSNNVSSLLCSGFGNPLGIAWMPSDRVAVCDGADNAIWLIDQQTKTRTWYAGASGATGDYGDGSASEAFFNQPTGVSAATDGSLVVADQLNHRLRLIDRNGYVSTLYGVSSNQWTNVWYPGWLDSKLGPVQSRLPSGVAIAANGDIYTTETYYSLVRKASGTSLSSTNPPPSTPSISPSYGYFLTAHTIAVSNAFGEVHYTTNGTEPTMSSPVVSNGTIIWNDAARDLSFLKLKSYYAGQWSATVSGELVTPSQPVISPECGFFPNPTEIAVYNQLGSVIFYTTDNTEPTVLSPAIELNNGVGTIPWNNTNHGLSWLRVKSCTALSRLSTTVTGATCQVDAPIMSPACGTFSQDTQVTVASSFAGYLEIYYTTNGAVPTMSSTRLMLTNNRGYITWPARKSLSLLRIRAFNGPDNPSPVGGGGDCTPTTPTFSPMSGFYVCGQTIYVTNAVGDVYYTSDGTEPTTNSQQVVMIDGVGSFVWQDSFHDLSFLRIKAFSGTQSSPTVSGLPSPVNSVGVPRSFFGGIGSEIVVPVVVSLTTNDTQIRSLQFRIEFTPITPGAPAIDADIEGLTVSTNSLVPAGASTTDGKESVYYTGSYHIGDISGAWYASIATNLLVKGNATVANFAIQIPKTSLVGDQYLIRVLEASATSDAQQKSVNLTCLPDQFLTITNIPILMGDTAVATWYNAGEFGDKKVDNADVNNAIDLSLGIRTCYTFSDAYAALDVSPVDSDLKVGGDQEVTFDDWTILLNRSLKLDTNVWYRYRTEGGAWKCSRDPNDALKSPMLKASPAPMAAATATMTAPGSVWVRNASLYVPPMENVTPGSFCSIPVSVIVKPGASLGGFQFSAHMEPGPGAPAMAQPLAFYPKSGMPSLFVNQAVGMDVACAWSIVPSAAFKPALQGSNFLGYFLWRVPADAQQGQSYTLHFSKSQGMADLNTVTTFESLPVDFWILSKAQAASPTISDEWKSYFFKNLDPLSADPNSDPDKDGVPNWKEYIAGTNPTNTESCLKFVNPAPLNKGALLRWLSAPGKSYLLQSSTSLSNGAWTTIGTVLGDGTLKEFTDTTSNGQPHFYRIQVQTP